MKNVFLAVAVFFLISAVASAAEPVKVGFISVLSGPLAPIGQSELNATKMAVEDAGLVLGQKAELYRQGPPVQPGARERAGKGAVRKGQGGRHRRLLEQRRGAGGLRPGGAPSAHLHVYVGRHDGADRQEQVHLQAQLQRLHARRDARRVGRKEPGQEVVYDHDAIMRGGTTFSSILRVRSRPRAASTSGTTWSPSTRPITAPTSLRRPRQSRTSWCSSTWARTRPIRTKAAAEYGLKKSVKIMHALLFELDIKGTGLETFAGDYTAAPWNWVVNQPGTKEWADRYYKAYGDRPTFMAAACYSATRQYLDAVKRARSKETDKVIKALEGSTYRDFFVNPGYIRPRRPSGSRQGISAEGEAARSA